LSSCSYNELSLCETDNPSFADCVEPIFEKNCIGCHFQNNDEIMPLTNFQEIQDKVINGTVIESIKREVGFMPKNGERLTAEEILIIENWKNNGAPNN
jgi:mono/diheme cytochrome c family protein